MNINFSDEIDKLSTEDFFKAVASATEPVAVYEDGKILEPHKFTELGNIAYADAKVVLKTRSDVRKKVISEYPEYGVLVAEPGDRVLFGSYPQRENKGADSIEWIVLARDNKKLMLISRYALDCRKYHDTYESVAWEKSDLRTWLNGEFVDTAFTKLERSMVPYSSVRPDKADNLYGNHGGNTLDKVFLLSPTEVTAYFLSDEDKICLATEIAVKHGVNTDNGNQACWWWLRTPGFNPMSYAQTFVNDFGEIRLNGEKIDCPDDGVRPVIWIGLE